MLYRSFFWRLYLGGYSGLYKDYRFVSGVSFTEARSGWKGLLLIFGLWCGYSGSLISFENSFFKFVSYDRRSYIKLLEWETSEIGAPWRVLLWRDIRGTELLFVKTIYKIFITNKSRMDTPQRSRKTIYFDSKKEIVLLFQQYFKIKILFINGFIFDNLFFICIDKWYN